MSNRLDQEKEALFQPKRVEYAIKQITALGFEIIDLTDKRICFMFKGSKVTLYPYSGWFAGKTVKDGRGIEHLIQQLKKG